MDEKDPENNQINRFNTQEEKRVWVATYERMQTNGDFIDASVTAADNAVIEYRKRL